VEKKKRFTTIPSPWRKGGVKGGGIMQEAGVRGQLEKVWVNFRSIAGGPNVD